MSEEIKDCSKMTDSELLVELTERVIAYDSLRDEELNFLGDNPNPDFWDSEMEENHNELLMNIDNAWCRLREIIRIVKKDDEFWSC